VAVNRRPCSIGENFLRIEVTGSTRPAPLNIVDLKSGAITLVYPHNRSFVRVKPESEDNSLRPVAGPLIPSPPPGVGAQRNPAAAGPPGAPAITPEKISDKDGKLFQAPEGYTEIQPLPF
jgi:hypothetical protein